MYMYFTTVLGFITFYRHNHLLNKRIHYVIAELYNYLYNILVLRKKTQ